MNYKKEIFIYCLSLGLMACSGGKTEDSSPLNGYGIHRGDLVNSQDHLFFKNTVLVVTTYNDKNGEYQNNACTGVVVTKKHILTAAHCIHEESAEMSNVTLFALPSFNALEASPNEFIRVKDYRLHKLYRKKTLENDLAMLVLDAPIEKAVPAKLSFKEIKNNIGQEYTVAGYGAYDTAGDDLKLRYAVMTQLFEAYPTDKTIRLTPKTGCPLGGDSGGPLYLIDVDGNPQVVGITSSNSGVNNFFGSCRELATYTLIAKYKDFIEESLAALK